MIAHRAEIMIVPVPVGLRIVYWRGDKLVDTTLIRWN